MKILCYNNHMKAINTKFSENLRLIRKQKGYTQNQLAEAAGVSRRIIDHYETQAKCPSLDKLIKIAEALTVSIDELVGISEIQNKKIGKSEEISFTLMKKMRVIEKLPTRERNTIFKFINTVVEKNKLKEELKKEKNKQPPPRHM